MNKSYLVKFRYSKGDNFYVKYIKKYGVYESIETGKWYIPDELILLEKYKYEKV